MIITLEKPTISVPRRLEKVRSSNFKLTIGKVYRGVLVRGIYKDSKSGKSFTSGRVALIDDEGNSININCTAAAIQNSELIEQGLMPQLEFKVLYTSVNRSNYWTITNGKVVALDSSKHKIVDSLTDEKISAFSKSDVYTSIHHLLNHIQNPTDEQVKNYLDNQFGEIIGKGSLTVGKKYSSNFYFLC
jgi:hypothetical protein